MLRNVRCLVSVGTEVCGRFRVLLYLICLARDAIDTGAENPYIGVQRVLQDAA